MNTNITWKPHGANGEITHLNGWSSEVWNYGTDGEALTHPAGRPYLWCVEPSRKRGWVADGFAPTQKGARRDAETALRRLAVQPAPVAGPDFLPEVGRTTPPLERCEFTLPS
jgi:hypothetical protein